MSIVTIAYNRQPIDDFKLPNNELIVLFQGANNNLGPYFQEIDQTPDELVFSNLQQGILNETLIPGYYLDGNSTEAVEIDWDGPENNFSPGFVVANQIKNNNGSVYLQYIYKNEDNYIAQPLSINSSLDDDVQQNPRLCTGYFTKQALEAKRKQLILACGRLIPDREYIYGCWLPPGSSELIYDRIHFWDFDETGSYTDCIALDFDGDGIDELITSEYSKRKIWGLWIMGFGAVQSWKWDEHQAFPGELKNENAHDILYWSSTFTYQDIMLSGGDIDGDGRDELVAGLRRDNLIEIYVMDYDPVNAEWNRVNYDSGLLKATYPLVRDESNEKIQIEVKDIDQNGYADIAEQVAKYHNIELKSGIGSTNRDIINYLRFVFYGIVLISLIFIIRRKFAKQ